MATLNDFPNEMLVKIFSYLNIIERQRIETVCKRWQSNIKKMFNIRSLKFICIGKGPQYDQSSCFLYNCVLYMRNEISYFPMVLRKFNGQLRTLDFELDIPNVEVSDEIFELIRRNKYLESVKVCGSNEEATKILFHMSCEHLKSFNLNVSYGATQLVGVELVVRHILDKADGLEFLALTNPTRSILNRISEMHTLKSLFLRIRDDALFEFDIRQLSNLENISIRGRGKLHRNFWKGLVENCTKLRAIEFDDPSRMLHSTMTALASLPNLRSVRLILPIGMRVVDYFSNLEEIYCTAAHYPVEVIHDCLQRSPSLKRCHFDYEDYVGDTQSMETRWLNQRFQKIAMEFGTNVDVSQPKNFLDAEWDKILFSKRIKSKYSFLSY